MVAEPLWHIFIGSYLSCKRRKLLGGMTRRFSSIYSYHAEATRALLGSNGGRHLISIQTMNEVEIKLVVWAIVRCLDSVWEAVLLAGRLL